MRRSGFIGVNSWSQGSLARSRFGVLRATGGGGKPPARVGRVILIAPRLLGGAGVMDGADDEDGGCGGYAPDGDGGKRD
jgi:hypothetical protein